MGPIDIGPLVEASILAIPHTPLRRGGRSVRKQAQLLFPTLLRWLVANSRQLQLKFKTKTDLESVAGVFPGLEATDVEECLGKLAKRDARDLSQAAAAPQPRSPERAGGEGQNLYILVGKLGGRFVRTELALDRFGNLHYTATLVAVSVLSNSRGDWEAIPLPHAANRPAVAYPPPSFAAPPHPSSSYSHNPPLEPLDGLLGPSNASLAGTAATGTETPPAGSAFRLRRCRLTELFHGTALVRVHLRVQLVALSPVASYPHGAELDESSDQVSLLLTDKDLRVHALPPGTEARLHLIQNTPSKYRLRVDFWPPLSPGQTAEFTLLLLRRQHRAMTLGEVQARISAGTYNIPRPLVPAIDAAMTWPIDSFVATTIFPRGYRARGPSVDVQHHYSRLSHLSEAQRLRDTGSLSVFSSQGRTVLRLSVLSPIERFAYFVYFEPPESFES